MRLYRGGRLGPRLVRATDDSPAFPGLTPEDLVRLFDQGVIPEEAHAQLLARGCVVVEGADSPEWRQSLERLAEALEEKAFTAHLPVRVELQGARLEMRWRGYIASVWLGDNGRVFYAHDSLEGRSGSRKGAGLVGRRPDGHPWGRCTWTGDWSSAGATGTSPATTTPPSSI